MTITFPETTRLECGILTGSGLATVRGAALGSGCRACHDVEPMAKQLAPGSDLRANRAGLANAQWRDRST